MNAPACHYCGTTDGEMRPYGPGGSWLCFSCMKADPAREVAAKGAFGALLDATLSLTGAAIIGETTGPRPATSVDVRHFVEHHGLELDS